MLEPYSEQIATWLDQDDLLLTQHSGVARCPARAGQVEATSFRTAGWPAEASALDGAHGAKRIWQSEAARLDAPL
jgi:hypothetical protein